MSDSYEEALVEMIVGFTEVINRVEKALPDSEYKAKLIHRLKIEKNNVAAHVIETMKL